MARLLGHPVHPMAASFPIAFWIGASVWDLVALVAPDPLWPRLAAWTLAAGVAAALPALATGTWELARLPAGHPAERLAWWHLGAMCSAWILFACSLLLRRPFLDSAEPAVSYPTGAALLSAAGVVLTLAGGWLGGELVFGHGVAVRDRAGSDTIRSERDD